MEDRIRQAYDAHRKFNRKGFRAGCYAPFVSLYFKTNGDVVACFKNQTFVLGNVSQQRLTDIWRGGAITKLRQALANYRFESGCEFCEWQVQGGSYETAYPWVFEEFPVSSMEPQWPAMIEFSGSNTCNFECIMCYGELSSTIRARKDRLPPLPKAYSEQFFQDLRAFLPHLRRAKFFGGEPFLAQECFHIWDLMIADKLSIPCHVTTNGSQYNPKVERVLEALPLSLSVSIDGATKETFEKIRGNADFERIMANLHRFRDYAKRRRTYLGISHCLMRQNWHEFGEVLLLAERLECEVFVNTVIDPSDCSLYTLPPQELSDIVDQLEVQSQTLKSRLSRNRAVWENTLKSLRSNANERQVEGVDKIKEAVEETKRDGQEGKREHLFVAWRLHDEHRYAEALDEVLKTPETDINYYHVLCLYGHLRRITGDVAGSEQTLDHAIQLAPLRPEAFFYRAWLRLQQGQRDKGIADATYAGNFLRQGDWIQSADVQEVLALLQQQE